MSQALNRYLMVLMHSNRLHYLLIVIIVVLWTLLVIHAIFNSNRVVLNLLLLFMAITVSKVVDYRAIQLLSFAPLWCWTIYNVKCIGEERAIGSSISISIVAVCCQLLWPAMMSMAIIPILPIAFAFEGNASNGLNTPTSPPSWTGFAFFFMGGVLSLLAMHVTYVVLRSWAIDCMAHVNEFPRPLAPLPLGLARDAAILDTKKVTLAIPRVQL